MFGRENETGGGWPDKGGGELDDEDNEEDGDDDDDGGGDEEEVLAAGVREGTCSTIQSNTADNFSVDALTTSSAKNLVVCSFLLSFDLPFSFSFASSFPLLLLLPLLLLFRGERSEDKGSKDDLSETPAIAAAAILSSSAFAFFSSLFHALTNLAQSPNAHPSSPAPPPATSLLGAVALSSEGSETEVPNSTPDSFPVAPRKAQ